jgi:hypothetical protein
VYFGGGLWVLWCAALVDVGLESFFVVCGLGCFFEVVYGGGV